MKSFILTTVSPMRIIPAVAKVWVKEVSLIYSKGTDIFIKGSINLESRYNIYLRKESQLLQADNANNVGIGELSIFQEGAANSFTYKFWSAPISQATGSGNQGFRNTQIKYSTLKEDFKLDGFSSLNPIEALNTFLVSSFNNSFILDNSFRDETTEIQTTSGTMITPTQQLRITSRWLYKYNNAISKGGSGGTGYGSWQPFETAARIVEPGYRFTIKGVTTTNGPNLFAQGSGSLFGKRYDFRGRSYNGPMTLRVIAGDFALFGNPYPSTSDLKKFSIYSTTIVSRTLADSSEIDAQVLFGESIATSHQLTDYIGGYGSYAPGSRTDLSDNGIYMAQEGKRLIIKTIPFAIIKKVPVRFVLLNSSTFEISVKSIQHFNAPLILLHDTQNGTIHDLKNSMATVAIPAGTYNEYFEIVFEQPTNLSSRSKMLTTAIAVFQNNNKQLMKVQNPELKDIQNIAVYDLAGRLIISEKTNTVRDNYSFNTANYDKEINIVRITDGAYSETAIKVSVVN